MTKQLRSWKKVFVNDLPNIMTEFKDSINFPAMIILSGELGAGKTTLTKFLTDISEFTSPSYSLIQELGSCAHADFYRLEDDSELIHLEIPLYLEGKDLFIVEWGKSFLTALDREVPENFHFYEVEIEINEGPSLDESGPSRNYHLFSISRR